MREDYSLSISGLSAMKDAIDLIGKSLKVYPANEEMFDPNYAWRNLDIDDLWWCAKN